MLYVVKDVHDPSKVYGTFQTGADAGKEAGRLNATWRSEGSETRARVVQETTETEPTCWVVGCQVPGLVCDASQAENHKKIFGITVREIPESGREWRRREMCRARRGKLPWAGQSWWQTSDHWAVHFPYPATSDSGKIAFTASEQHGRDHRQKVMRPGAYLRKFFGGTLSECDVQYWALEWSNRFSPVDLEYAVSADEIEDVYTNGPTSCMGYSADSFDACIHPVRAYAGPDLQVAYIRNSNNDISGRAVVWPAKYEHGQIYGDIERMQSALEEAGYTKSRLAGARMSLIESPAGIHAPYLDGCQEARQDGDYLVIERYGDLICDSTTGTIGRGDPCSNCGERVCEDDVFFNGDGEAHCHECFDELYEVCEGCQEHHYCDDMNVCPDGYDYCSDCYNEKFVSCDGCSKVEVWDHLLEAPNGQELCVSCYADNVRACEDCSEPTMGTDVQTVGTDELCEFCAEDRVKARLELEEEETPCATV